MYILALGYMTLILTTPLALSHARFNYISLCYRWGGGGRGFGGRDYRQTRNYPSYGHSYTSGGGGGFYNPSGGSVPSSGGHDWWN